MTNPTNSQSRKLKELGKSALLTLVTIAVCIGLLEVVVRIIQPKEVMRYFYSEDHPILHHHFIPHAEGRYKTIEFDTDYKINSLGLRDKEYAIPKPRNTFRILMLGDSFTEGDGVMSDETFSKILEEKLHHISSPVDFEVINAGVGSYSTLLEYLYLKDFGLRLAPDLVMLHFDLSDVHDDINYTSVARFDEKGNPVAVVPTGTEHGLLKGPMASVKDWFKDNFRLYNFIRIRITPYLDRKKREGNFAGDIRHDKYGMLRENYVDADSNWALTHKYLLLIRDMLREKGVDFWLTTYPYGLQVHPKEWSMGRGYWGFRSDTVYSSWPQEKLGQWAASQHIRFIDFTPDFKELSKTVFPLYLDNNGHWVVAGHQLVANILFRDLQPYFAQKLTAFSVSRQTSTTINH